MFKLLLKLSLEHRVLTLALAISVCAYGLVAALGLPVDVLPDLNRPTVSILTEAHGLAPEEVEARVTAPIENAVNGATGVERLRSVSGIGLSVVHVEFSWDTGIMADRQVVQERLNSLQARLPEGSIPQMGPVSSIMGEIMLIGLASKAGDDNAPALTPTELRSLADWTLRPALLAIPGIAQVSVIGGELRQFQVRADPERLRLYGLTLADLESAVREANAASAGGIVFGSGDSTEMVVRNVGRVATTEQLGAALVATRAAESHTVPVRIRDVARVIESGAIAKRGDASMMGAPAVVLAIAKQPGGDTRALTRALDQRLAEIGPSLPPALVINPDLFRQSRFIDAAISNIIEALRDGSILVVIVLVIFLLNFRVTIITLTAIPLSLLATAIVFKLLGQSINTMTLGGIAVAIGELVDDAIVGVENVHRRLKATSQREGSEGGRSGLSSAQTLRIVFEATSEVRGPILIGTTIVLLVFLPLFFLPDLAGKLFTPLAWAYIISIFASMIVSLSVTPVLAYFLLGLGRGSSDRESSADHDGALLRACKFVALRAYSLTLPRPRLTIAASIIAVVAAAFLSTRLGSEFLPPFNEGTAVIAIASTPGTSLIEANRIGTAAEKMLLEIPEVRSVARRTGRAEQDEHALGVDTSEIEVAFFGAGKAGVPASSNSRVVPAKMRPRSEVFAEIRERLSQLPVLGVSIGQPISHRIEHLETGVQAQIVIKVAGAELTTLRTLAAQVNSTVSEIPGVVDLQTEAQVLVPQILIRVDSDRAARYGFRAGDLTSTLETALGGKVVSQILDGLRSYDLVVMLDDPWVGRSSSEDAGGSGGVEALKFVRLLSPSGAVALVSDVAEIREQFAPNQIAREGGQRRIVVSCNVEGRDQGATAAAIAEELKADVTAPTGYTIRVEGQFEAQKRANRVMFSLGSLSLVLMFVILVGHFRSVMLALQVMLNVPFAFIGAVLALWITGEPFSLASLIGLISLCGIAVRNGVLMLSHYSHLAIHEHVPFGRELVIRGSQERVAPVLMTALTTGLGMAPLIVAGHTPGKEILYPVAVVVLGGLLTCTLLDFFVTPTVFLRFGGDAIRGLKENPERNLGSESHTVPA